MTTNSMMEGCAENACTPVTGLVRAYFAAVNRNLPSPVAFDASVYGQFDLEAPPAPWVDLGWVDKFTRKSASRTAVLAVGAPAATKTQIREQLDAVVGLRFLHWGKLQMALAAGSEHWNLFATGDASSVTLAAGSTATTLMMSGMDAARFHVGQAVAVDVDYAGQTGYIGSGSSAAYVQSPSVVQGDVHYIRRVTLNVGQVSAVTANGVQLAEPLLAGAPTTSMQVQPVVGFMDREGGTFFQEWSALFVMQGAEGERILYNYPRLQTAISAQEVGSPIAGTLERVCLTGEFRALPVVDGRDGQSVLCYRSFLPAPGMPL